jgi:outer membrane protein assembly factor BamB
LNKRRCVLGLASLILGAAVVVLAWRPTFGYIEAAHTLGKVINDSTNVLVVRVEAVDKQKNTIIYRKVQDLKGNHPGELIKHNIAQAGFHPREWQNVMAWAEVGRTAVIFHNGGASETCIENYWYQAYAGEWWGMSHAEPFLLRAYAGKPEKLIAFVTQILAGQEVVVPCMADDKPSLHLRAAKYLRMKASLKIQEYNFQRDFVEWGAGGDEFRPVQGMPGFTHLLSVSQSGRGIAGIAPADLNGNGRPALCLYGASQISLLQNGGNSFDETRLPNVSGARGASWADYDGDGKPDLLLATPTGPRLFRYTGKEFQDVSATLPQEGYHNLRAAAWIDYDGDGKPDILLADGFRGLRLYRNMGKVITPQAPLVLGPWHYAGPFDNIGEKGFDTVYPPEQGVDIKAEYSGKNKEKVTWKEGKFTDGQANSLSLFKPEQNDNCVCYVYREITAKGPMSLPVGFGSDDTLTVWLNGEKIVSQNVYRGCTVDETKLTLNLKPGVNKLLLKICNGSGEFAFAFSSAAPAPIIPLSFEDVSDAVGLGEKGIGSGMRGDHLAVADVNGDGKADFLFSAGTGLLVLGTGKGFQLAGECGISYQTGDIAPAFGDFNGDSKPDLIIPQHKTCKLLRNDSIGNRICFTDVTAMSGDLAKGFGDARCAAFCEFRKGRQDVIVGCWNGPNQYFMATDKGVFADWTEAVGLSGRIFNTSAVAVLDLNKDGTPDVVFNNEGQDSTVLLSNTVWFASNPKLPDPVAAGAGLATLPGGIGTTTGGGWGKKLLLAACLLGLVIGGIRLKRRGRTAALIAFGALAFWASDATAADWPTARGTPQRTGCVDDKPGPKAPGVLWIYKAQQHFVAPPVPGEKAIHVSALGAMNVGIFHALSTADNAPERVLWSKTVPYITRPTVCAPAIAEGLIIFGDGMHQTDDAILYCLQAGSGMPVWQFPVPGKLVHLEAGPTIDKGRVYACGGDAAVICVDIKHVTFEGKEQDIAAVLPAQQKRWADMLAKYEEEKKKDPLMAMPPSDDALPKAQPKMLWQQGKGQWHIDAPPVVAGDFVLAASAYLDDEKIGKRCLVCLKAADGAIAWETPLNLNPWAGPTIAGPLVIVGCSSIRFDRKLIDQAKGEIVAVELATGKVRWKQDVAGGVLSSIAAKGDLIVATSTNGQVVARRADNGQTVWTHQAKNPFFGGPAIAGDTVYAADLKSILYALNLADGKVQWTFDVGGAPSVQNRSMVFGSPTVHGGDIYLATCNLDADNAQACYVVCISDRRGKAEEETSTPLDVDTKNRTITIPCRIAPRKLPTLKEVYPLEVCATFPSPRGEKAHETVVIFDAKPSEVHKALEALGLKPGKPVRGEGEPTGSEVQLSIEYTAPTGKPRLVPMDKVLIDTRTGKAMPSMTWRFTGSVMRQPDPDKPDKVYGADLSGTLISLLPVTDETVFQAQLAMKDGEMLRLDTNKGLLPPEGSAVKLVITAK